MVNFTRTRNDGETGADILRRFSDQTGRLDQLDPSVTTELPQLTTASLSDTVSASLANVIVVMRWGALILGVAFTYSQAAPNVLVVMAAVAVVVFMTTWRTVSPLGLTQTSPFSVMPALIDVALLSFAVGLAGGFNNPLVGAVFVTMAVVGFGWGFQAGMAGALIGLSVSTTTLFISVRYLPDRFLAPDTVFSWPNYQAVLALVLTAAIPGIAHYNLSEVENRNLKMASQNNSLAQTNELLGALNQLARTLPSSLDLTDVLRAARAELTETFNAKRVALLIYEDGKWSPLLQTGFNLAPEISDNELPEVMRRTIHSTQPYRVRDLSLSDNRPGSGIYARLVVRSADIGLVAVEHTSKNYYRSRDASLLGGMAGVLALTLSNARSFNRLRSLAAAEERSRIARDLHDRLGQYLTYIALELERIHQHEPSTELLSLHGNVQSAIGEFRDTLLELRTAVSADRPLGVVLTEVVERFSARSNLSINLVVPTGDARLPARIENEFLRITQEALTNIEKHANATSVHIAWSIVDDRGTLTVQDNGRGFDPALGIRGTAYGLVGMRERAASVGALLTISSQSGQGTAITVQSSQTAY